jgi:hypothetical protein
MPYKSKAQQGLFHSPNSPVGPAEVAKWDAASKGRTGLPEHVKHPKGNAAPMQYGETAVHMQHPIHAEAYLRKK